MPRITKAYTRAGDSGRTYLGSGKKVSKASPRIEAYGTVDELNSQLGVVLSIGISHEYHAPMLRIQNYLFHLGSDLCIPDSQKNKPVPVIMEKHVKNLENLTDKLSKNLPPLKNFILPGGCQAAAQIHVARTVCRRAERAVVALSEKEKVNPLNIKYLNRLSSFLFVLARHENKSYGISEQTWNSRA